MHRVVVSGGSFGSSPLEQHIGLGRARVVQEIEVRWPASGVVQTLRGLEPDQRYRVREGEDRALPLPPRTGGVAFVTPQKTGECRPRPGGTA